jgi:hypothetical protein
MGTLPSVMNLGEELPASIAGKESHFRKRLNEKKKTLGALGANASDLEKMALGNVLRTFSSGVDYSSMSGSMSSSQQIEDNRNNSYNKIDSYLKGDAATIAESLGSSAAVSDSGYSVRGLAVGAITALPRLAYGVVGAIAGDTYVGRYARKYNKSVSDDIHGSVVKKNEELSAASRKKLEKISNAFGGFSALGEWQVKFEEAKKSKNIVLQRDVQREYDKTMLAAGYTEKDTDVSYSSYLGDAGLNVIRGSIFALGNSERDKRFETARQGIDVLENRFLLAGGYTGGGQYRGEDSLVDRDSVVNKKNAILLRGLMDKAIAKTINVDETAQLKSMVRGNSSLVRTLGISNMTLLEKSDKDTIGNSIANLAQSKELNVDDYSAAKSRLLATVDAIQVKSEELKKQSGDAKTKTEKELDELRKERDNLDIKVKNLKPDGTSSSPSSNSATVHPPLMNYWNNKWAL